LVEHRGVQPLELLLDFVAAVLVHAGIDARELRGQSPLATLELHDFGF